MKIIGRLIDGETVVVISDVEMTELMRKRENNATGSAWATEAKSGQGKRIPQPVEERQLWEITAGVGDKAVRRYTICASFDFAAALARKEGERFEWSRFATVHSPEKEGEE